MTDDAPLDVETAADGVAVLTLRRPHRLNALSTQLVDTLRSTLHAIGRDRSVRVVVLTGAGRAFCSGGDLKDMDLGTMGAGPEGPQLTEQFISYLGELVSHLRHLRQPVIAAINGAAYGGGLALACAADIRIAAESATFSTQFIRMGLSGCEMGLSYTLPRLIGVARAQELILTSRVIDGAEAERIGLVSRVVPDHLLLGAATELAGALCLASPFGLELTKQVLRANVDAPSLDSAVQLESRTQALAAATGAPLEAVAAFRQKRPPAWGGNPRTPELAHDARP